MLMAAKGPANDLVALCALAEHHGRAASDRGCSLVLGEQKQRTNQDRASDEKTPRTDPSDPTLSATCHLPKLPDPPKTVLSA